MHALAKRRQLYSPKLVRITVCYVLIGPGQGWRVSTDVRPTVALLVNASYNFILYFQRNFDRVHTLFMAVSTRASRYVKYRDRSNRATRWKVKGRSLDASSIEEEIGKRTNTGWEVQSHRQETGQEVLNGTRNHAERGNVRCG